MARKSSYASAGDVAEIEREIGQLMRDLESSIGRLNSLSKRGVSHAVDDAGEYVSETLTDAAERLRESATEAVERMRNGAQTVTDEATRMGSDAIHRLEDEIGQRPLLTLAIAAGIGFLAGMAGRRH
jgi:ElaB/YqjD/DUF883 family membrane-anchored ribosome-binding protein